MLRPQVVVCKFLFAFAKNVQPPEVPACVNKSLSFGQSMCRRETGERLISLICFGAAPDETQHL